MKRCWKAAAAMLLSLAGLSSHSQTVAPDQERRNWFEDPFFQLSSGIAACPVPLGPMLTRDEQRREAHGRIERGTSCWLAGKCRDSNAYRYDKGLAAPVKAALMGVPGLDRTSIWVTIQRRWVFLEGCVASPGQSAQLAQAAREVTDVESVVPILSLPGQAPRYQLRDTPEKLR
jgi:hypothetical protein